MSLYCRFRPWKAPAHHSLPIIEQITSLRLNKVCIQSGAAYYGLCTAHRSFRYVLFHQIIEILQIIKTVILRGFCDEFGSVGLHHDYIKSSSRWFFIGERGRTLRAGVIADDGKRSFLWNASSVSAPLTLKHFSGSCVKGQRSPLWRCW